MSSDDHGDLPGIDEIKIVTNNYFVDENSIQLDKYDYAMVGASQILKRSGKSQPSTQNNLIFCQPTKKLFVYRKFQVDHTH